MEKKSGFGSLGTPWAPSTRGWVTFFAVLILGTIAYFQAPVEYELSPPPKALGGIAVLAAYCGLYAYLERWLD